MPPCLVETLGLIGSAVSSRLLLIVSTEVDVLIFSAGENSSDFPPN